MLVTKSDPDRRNLKFSFALAGTILSIVFLRDYFSFLMAGVVVSLLISNGIVDEIRLSITNPVTPEQHRRILIEKLKNKNLFLMTAISVGLLFGAAFYLVKKLFVFIF
jgi:uncharacterized Fe-S cluster-containing radical SAM superfamily protein